MMTDLPLEFQQFAAFLDSQPAPLQIAFRYCLCLIMVEAGKMELLEIIPGQSGRLYTFKTMTGEVFSIAKPRINKEQEAALIRLLTIKLDLNQDQL